MLWQGAAGLRQAIGIQIAGLFEDGQTAAERAWQPLGDPPILWRGLTGNAIAPIISNIQLILWCCLSGRLGTRQQLPTASCSVRYWRNEPGDPPILWRGLTGNAIAHSISNC